MNPSPSPFDNVRIAHILKAVMLERQLPVLHFSTHDFVLWFEQAVGLPLAMEEANRLLMNELGSV
ncbi:hypothetical protein L1D15_00005, partial [Vibrio sp. Isolate25]|uniref:hypothetical protein n=1 Tax=Vibrio sp. Isolate25 TaxID=2908535 RepID=UPI001EFD4152